MYVLREYQREASQAGIDFLLSSRKRNGIVVAPTGCHAKGTGIVMADGTVKLVEDIRLGDILIGPDSTPRTVLRLRRGAQPMFRITPHRGGAPFVVNEDHMLSLVSTNEGNKSYPSSRKGGEQEFITLNEYLKKSKSWRHLRKLHRAQSVDFHQATKLPLPPWIVGVILGDGYSGIAGVSVTTADHEIVKDIRAFARAWWLDVKVSQKKNNAAVSLIITKPGRRKHRAMPNPLRVALKTLGMDGKTAAFKSVPPQYKTASPRDRLELLAGLLDTDGSLSRGQGFDFISKSPQLANDVTFVTRSLGLTASQKACKKTCQNGKSGTYYRVHISGDLDRIPCRIARKKACARGQKKNHLVTGFAVEPIGIDRYYGFTLDADHLYLTSDFFVHHNCGKSLIIASIVQGLNAPCLVFQPSKEILEQNLQKFQSYGYRPAVYSASMGRKTVGEITLCTIGSVAGNKARASKAHLFQDFPYVLVDECDLVGAKSGQYKAFFSELDVKILGLTATPYRLSTDFNGSILKWLTRTRPKIFQDVVYYIQTGDLFDEGYLAKPTYKHWPAFNRHAVKANSTGADFDDRQLQMYFANTNFQGKVVKAVEKLLEMGRKSVLVFTRFIPEAQYVTSKIPGAAIVTADTPKAEREAIIREFRAGRIPVVANVGVLSIGFDYPELDTVVLARPTKSLRLFYQQVGRVVRQTPNKEPMVVDLVGLIQEFGKIEDLKIVDGGNGKWFIENTERQLTNVYFSSEGASRCHECGQPVGFWMRHCETGNRAPLQRPTNGTQGNINLVHQNGGTFYTVVKAGEGEFVHHAAACERRRMTG